MILGIDGPFEPSNRATVLLFESFLFNKTTIKSTGEKLESARISLENRWAVVRSPNQWMDNLVGSVDALEFEMKTLPPSEQYIVCLHTNDLLITQVIPRLKAFGETFPLVKLVLSIAVPENIDNEVQGTEYLVSHVHYGMGNGSILFGMLGPLVIDESTSAIRVKMYINAQRRAGNVLLVCRVISSSRLEFFLPEFDMTRTVFFSSSTESFPAVAIRGVTIRPDSLPTDPNLLERAVVSTGVEFKTDMKKYGGLGIDFSVNYLRNRIPDPQWEGMQKLASSLLEFHWQPPKLDVRNEDESPKWICHMCGLVSRLSDQENYTKHGFTYCSIACLSEHRRKGFQS